MNPMKYSAWPMWLKVIAGVANFLVVSVTLFLWWPKNERHRWLILVCALYLFLFWLYMHT
jgi:hypothetical protein